MVELITWSNFVLLLTKVMDAIEFDGTEAERDTYGLLEAKYENKLKHRHSLNIKRFQEDQIQINLK